jgi:hypothetical protein
MGLLKSFLGEAILVRDVVHGVHHIKRINACGVGVGCSRGRR